MTHVQSFKFDLRFDTDMTEADNWTSDTDGFSVDRMGEAAAPAEAPEEIEPEPVFTSEELEAARRKALEEGERRGRAAAAASIDGKIQQMLTRMTDELARLLETQNSIDSDLIEQTVQLSMAYTAKLMPELSRRQGIVEIEAVARECLQGMLMNPRVVLHVSDQQVEPARERIDALAQDIGYDGTIVIRSDPGLTPGDCRIDWAEGGAERIAAEIWKDIDGAVARTLGVTADDRIPEPTTASHTADAPDAPDAPAEPSVEAVESASA